MRIADNEPLTPSKLAGQINLMSATVIIKYTGETETSKIENVPYTCTIEKLKRSILKINQCLENNNLKLVNKGRILNNNEETVGNLYLEEGQQIIVYAVGIKKFKPVLPQEAQIQPPRAEIPAFRPQNPQIRNNNQMNQLKLMMKIVIILSLVMGILAGALILLNDEDMKDEFKKLPKLKIRAKPLIIGVLVISSIILLYYIFIHKNNIQSPMIQQCLKVFFKLMLPTWDMEQFKRENGVQ